MLILPVITMLSVYFIYISPRLTTKSIIVEAWIAFSIALKAMEEQESDDRVGESSDKKVTQINK